MIYCFYSPENYIFPCLITLIVYTIHFSTTFQSVLHQLGLVVRVCRIQSWHQDKCHFWDYCRRSLRRWHRRWHEVRLRDLILDLFVVSMILPSHQRSIRPTVKPIFNKIKNMFTQIHFVKHSINTQTNNFAIFFSILFHSKCLQFFILFEKNTFKCSLDSDPLFPSSCFIYVLCRLWWLLVPSVEKKTSPNQVGFVNGT